MGEKRGRGRPKKPVVEVAGVEREGAAVQMTIRIPPEDHARLMRECDEFVQSPGQRITYILRQYWRSVDQG